MANTLLKQYFPLIQTRREILKHIQKKPRLRNLYQSWSPEAQNYFIDFCTGAKGVKILYDSFFKTVFNPAVSKKRLEKLLSLLLNQNVKIIHVLPNDDTRLTAEGSLLIMDILVQLADGSLANIECQKIGYDFPGERCACYSADLLLRQYVRVKNDSENKLNYQDIKSVYTIVFMQESTKKFHSFPNDYIHHFKQQSNTGLELNLLQEFFLIPLDIFTEIRHNKTIENLNELEAWLTFLSTDEPEEIVELITYHPEFKPLYEDIYSLCLNTERVMHMYSKELQRLDANTVDYMIERMRKEIEEQKIALKEQEESLIKSQKENAIQAKEIAELKRLLSEAKK